MTAAQVLDQDPENPPRGGRARGYLGDVCPDAIRRHLGLVEQVVSQMGRRLPANVLRDDLVAAGVCGLMDSLKRNGGSDGETFEWYARMRIRGAILDELRAQDWLPRRARDAASAQNDGAPPRGVVHVADMSAVEDVLAHAAAANDPSEEIEARSVHRALVRAIALLPERERGIVAMHYFEGRRFKEIGAHFGVSEPRISQLHARALEKLRALLDSAA